MAGIVIVGAGECGVRAAFALREAGFGGSVRLISAEDALPYERPPLSKTCPTETRAIASANAYADQDISLSLGTTAANLALDAGTLTLDTGEVVSFTKLLLAIGARPRVLAGQEAALTLRTVADARAIMARLVPGLHIAIIGGGFIGLELAATARARGCAVTVIEAGDRLLARAVPAEIAAAALSRHLDAGVTIRLSSPVLSTTSERVDLADGTAIAADLVIAGTGSYVDTTLAEKAGLEVNNGIAVDACLRTSSANVFAAGDCCSFPWRGQRLRLESWRAAQEQGFHAANAMLGATNAYDAVPWFWSDQHDFTIQVAGLTDPARTTLRRDLGDDAFLLFQTDVSGELTSVAGIGRGNSVARDIRLAEMMIAKRLTPAPAELMDPNVSLKALLRG